MLFHQIFKDDDIYEMRLGTNTFENWSCYGMAMTSSTSFSWIQRVVTKQF